MSWAVRRRGWTCRPWATRRLGARKVQRGPLFRAAAGADAGSVIVAASVVLRNAPKAAAVSGILFEVMIENVDDGLFVAVWSIALIRS